MLHIFTLHWNKKDSLGALKDSLLPALHGLEWVWHIKDNSSCDGSIEKIENWNHNNINLIKYKDNKQNYSQGMNFLFKETNPKPNDVILTLNNDIIFNDTTSLHNMINLLNKEDIGLVGAKLNYKDSTKIQHAGVLFYPAHGLPYHYRAHEEETNYDRQNRLFPIVTGAVSLIKADILRELMFNENYFWAFDDCDFSMRVKYFLNKEIVCCGQTNIFHEESSTLKKNPVNKVFFYQNANLFLNTWRNYIDISLPDKYQQTDYNLYLGK